MAEPIACREGEGRFPEYIRILDAGKGEVEVTISELGLLSPVAKIKMPRRDAILLFYDAAYRLEGLPGVPE